MITAVLVSFLLLQVPANAITVDGPDLKTRYAAAIKLGTAQRGPFWVANTFPVRPGVAFDVDLGRRGSATLINGTVTSSRVGVFVLHEGSMITRAEIYRLERPRDYAGYPLYWLGDGASSESLAFLRGLADNTTSPAVAGRLVDAMGAHDDPRVADTLREVIAGAKHLDARTSAVSWLGLLPGQVGFLAALVRDERENLGIRREAAESLGDSSDPEAMPALQSLYKVVTNRPLKLDMIEAIGDSSFEGAAVSILVEIAESETVRELRHQAIEELGDIPHERAISALIRLYDVSNDDETKAEILDALGEADVEPAWQKLAAVAQRDSSLKLRKQAIELLGESDNPKAAGFLEQLIR